MLPRARMVEMDGNAVDDAGSGCQPETHAPVEGDRARIGRRGDAAHFPAAPGPRGIEETFVQHPPQARRAQRGVDADEMDVGHARFRLRDEADQEGTHFPGLAGDEAGVLEMLEEQALQQPAHGPAAPPVVHHRGDGFIVVDGQGAQGGSVMDGCKGICRVPGMSRGHDTRVHARPMPRP